MARQLEIILYEENGEWVADTNLPGTPPAPRDPDWRVAVGLLMHMLVTERETWGEIAYLPKWTVRQEDGSTRSWGET